VIGDAVSKAHNGRATLEGMSGAVRELIASAEQAKSLVGSMHKTSSEQFEGMSRLTKSLENIQSLTQQTASHAEESAAAGEELSAQAQSMRALSGRLSAVITGA
jgi:methyl-accepting chemotaxis protein